jgi:hypothetical protein
MRGTSQLDDAAAAAVVREKFEKILKNSKTLFFHHFSSTQYIAPLINANPSSIPSSSSSGQNVSECEFVCMAT